MTTHAINTLKESLQAAQLDYAEIATENEPAIRDGQRAQARVDVAASRVEDLQRAVSALERIERENQQEVDE